MWPRYDQVLSYIELNQMSAFFSYLISIRDPVFHCWKAKRGSKLPRNTRTPENDRLYIFSLWVESRLGINAVLHRSLFADHEIDRVIYRRPDAWSPLAVLRFLGKDLENNLFNFINGHRYSCTFQSTEIATRHWLFLLMDSRQEYNWSRSPLNTS